MHDQDVLELTDRQARAVIVAAEARGFEREPDLYEAWYDAGLHEDARCAVAHLRARDPDALREALIADDPIAADCAARRITNSGRFSLEQAYLAVELASQRGFAAPELSPNDWHAAFEQGQAAVAFLWDEDPLLLSERLGEAARIATLPPTARRPGLSECDW